MVNYVLKPKLPGGIWLALGLIVIGLALLVFSLGTTSYFASRLAGCILCLIGLVLLTLILVGLFRNRVSITFDSEGYSITSPRGEFSGAWIDVTDVSISRKNAKIALWHGPQRRTVIAHPARFMDDEFMRVREGIRSHVGNLH